MVLLPLCILGFGWVSQERVHVAVLCVMLFLCGLSLMYVLTSISLHPFDPHMNMLPQMDLLEHAGIHRRC
jgi:hypothetical protein